MRTQKNSIARVTAILIALIFAAAPAVPSLAPLAATRADAAPPRLSANEAVLAKAYRFDRGGWTFVHLEGAPHDIGYQHGYLLGPEIADAFAVVRLEMTHDTGRSWEFFRRAGREMLWPKIDAEYQAELQGIADGLAARKIKLDLDDMVAFNAFSELPDYYVPYLDQKVHGANFRPVDHARNHGAEYAGDRGGDSAGHCSAFVAAGSWTKDGQIVMAHSNWTTYIEGSRWKIVFDIAPQQGFHVLMDGFPGAIASDDDFGVNSAGMMITETTISNFHGFDPDGKPEFIRARKAMQYADSIDSYAKIMLDGNNGGYANDWLLGDRKTGEIARFELGLRHHNLWRTKDGYFSGANFPSDPDVIRDETTFDANNPAGSSNARRIRWDQLIGENKGKIDVAMAETFLGDHYDTFTKTEGANKRTLCSHYETVIERVPDSSSRAYDPYGAVSGKAIDSRMAEAMTFTARIGHPCGTTFDAVRYLQQHSDYSWQAPVMRDMIAGPWTNFRSGDHEEQ